MEIKKYFSIKELVDQEVHQLHGESAWRFIDTQLLECLLIIRECIGQPITVNNWTSKGRFSQRGLRHNQSPMVVRKNRPYLSAHMFGKAVDFDVRGMEAEEVRDWIKLNIDRFPCKIRLEHKKNGVPINWVHLDVIQDERNDKLKLFNV